MKFFKIWASGSGGDVVQRKVYARWTDARQTKTDHNSLTLAFGSGELKIAKSKLLFFYENTVNSFYTKKNI